MNGNTFDEYKDKVEYDYIITGTVKCEMKGENNNDETKELSYEQENEACEQLQKKLDTLYTDDDFLKNCFPEVGLGRVYTKISDIEDTITITFGISKLDSEQEFNTDDLKQCVAELMRDIGVELESVNVSGLGGNEDPTYDTEPLTVSLVTDEAVIIKVEKEPKQESVKEMTQDIDKKLVKEGKLILKKENSALQEFVLTDDGVIEHYSDGKICNSQPFSKLAIIRECKSVLQDGYNLVEDLQQDEQNKELQKQILDNPDEVKQDIEQGIEDAKEIQQLKDELSDTVAELTEEKETEEDVQFPSSDYTKIVLTPQEIKEFLCQERLTPEQCTWVSEHFNSVEEFEESLNIFAGILSMPQDIPFISIDDYINYMLEEGGIR